MKNSVDSGGASNKVENLRLPKPSVAAPVKPTTQYRNVNELLKDLPITDETACGIWSLKGPLLQKFANKEAYVFVYGLLGLLHSAEEAYFKGTITTVEKRFKISSQAIGIINVGYDIAGFFTSLGLIYYAGQGHRPRWTAISLYLIGFSCIFNLLPHLLFGSSEDALMLTQEYGKNVTSLRFDGIISDKDQEKLCLANRTHKCEEEEEGNLASQVLLFGAQFIEGIGGALYYTVGFSYIDDNVKKSKSPALITLSLFLKMLGPAIGYALAAFTLDFYISPSLTPVVTTSDPRWLGAWWMGYLILAIPIFVFASVMALFPKSLPRAAARKILALERNKSEVIGPNVQTEVNKGSSFSEMIVAYKRLLSNVTFMCNNVAAIFYVFGYMPYWVFLPKYIEIQYRQSASSSSLVTGTVGLIFTAIGILLSGMIISKYRPKARSLALWNVMVGVFSVAGMVAILFLGCTANDNQTTISQDGSAFSRSPCNEKCSCDYVTFNQVCSATGESFISACHAGCRNITVNSNGAEVYIDCQCIKPKRYEDPNEIVTTSAVDTAYGTANPGSCPVDCTNVFYLFLAIMCAILFLTASGRSSNFIVALRCVDERDKAVSIGFNMAIMTLFGFIPAPIFSGYILDKTCLIWGKTCSSDGNCWLYNGAEVRYTINILAAGFLAVGTMFDVGVWYLVKGLKVFDEEVELQDITKNQEGDKM